MPQQGGDLATARRRLIKDRYEVVETLGAGGEGRVVKALDCQHDRLVACGEDGALKRLAIDVHVDATPRAPRSRRVMTVEAWS